MSSEEVVADYLPLVSEFLDRVEAASESDDDDDDLRETELRSISNLIRFARDFYAAFLKDQFRVEVSGFSYPDKRRVSRRLVRAERATEPPGPALWLAQLFEDLCDALHGEIEFGYSDSDEAYREFHQNEFPQWLYQLAEWLAEINPPLEEQVAAVVERYVRVV